MEVKIIIKVSQNYINTRDEDELYPFYNFEIVEDPERILTYLKTTSISEETLEHWKRVMYEFFEVQKAMKALH